MASNSCIGMLMEESDNPGFFKVLGKEDLSSQTMREIPQDFLKSISAKEFSFKMVLNLPWGSSWKINLSKYQSFYYYMEKNGWDQFLSDNGLGDDELLTFTHKGNMCFNVSIYQINCLERLRPNRSATIASSSSRNKREEVSNGKEEERESLSASNYSVSETAESTVGGRLKQKRQLINLGKKQVKKAEKANKCKKRKMDTDSDDSEDGTSSLAPEFTLTIKKSYVLFLGVPKRFAEMHMPKEETVFKIHDPKGKKSWEVTYVVSKIQSRFSRGWPGLVKDFGLEVGDVCTIELIKPTEMILTVSK